METHTKNTHSYREYLYIKSRHRVTVGFPRRKRGYWHSCSPCYWEWRKIEKKAHQEFLRYRADEQPSCWAAKRHWSREEHTYTHKNITKRLLHYKLTLSFLQNLKHVIRWTTGSYPFKVPSMEVAGSAELTPDVILYFFAWKWPKLPAPCNRIILVAFRMRMYSSEHWYTVCFVLSAV